MDWPNRTESREILLDYIAQFEVEEDDELPPDPDPDGEDGDPA
jgi:hypothetical protein